MTSNSLSEISQFWTTFDLSTWSEIIPKTSEVIGDNQTRSLDSRKELATATKKFRQRPLEERLSTLGSFVKKYQREVDELTARALYAENAFVKLAKALDNAPDPALMLQKAYQQLPKVKELKRKNKRLEDEVKELEKEFDGLSNQDITIRELQIQIQALERGTDTKIEGLAAQHVEELEFEFEEKTKELDKDIFSTSHCICTHV